MEKIHPRDRFSHNPRVAKISDEYLAKALAKTGIDFKNVSIQRLHGGYMNANFLIDENGQRQILRAYSSPFETAQSEFDTLNFLASTNIKAPKVYNILTCDERPVVMMEYIDGITLESRLLNGPPVSLKIYENIGRELAKIHSINLGQTGFINSGMRIGGEYLKFTHFVKDFIFQVLQKLESHPDKLDLETNLRVTNLVHDKWQPVIDSEKTIQLAHCDFNPKNILVSQTSDEVMSIIDWEFTLSGSGLIDLGNFFRFSYDYADGAQEALARGYKTILPELADNWRDLARLMDLGNMCSFLERPEDYQKTFRTARTIIYDTLEYFGY